MSPSVVSSDSDSSGPQHTGQSSTPESSHSRQYELIPSDMTPRHAQHLITRRFWHRGHRGSSWKCGNILIPSLRASRAGAA